MLEPIHWEEKANKNPLLRILNLTVTAEYSGTLLMAHTFRAATRSSDTTLCDWTRIRMLIV
jgi:hypothetical protein